MKLLNFLYQTVILKILNFFQLLINIINFIINFIIDLAIYLYNILIIIPFNTILNIFIIILNIIYNTFFIPVKNFLKFLNLDFLVNFLKKNIINNIFFIYNIFFKGKFLINDYYYHKILFNSRKYKKYYKYIPTPLRQSGWQLQKLKKFGERQYNYVKIRQLGLQQYDVRLRRLFFLHLMYRSNKYNFTKLRSSFFHSRSFGKYFIFHYRPKPLKIFKQKKYLFKNFNSHYNYLTKYKKSLSLITRKTLSFKNPNLRLSLKLGEYLQYRNYKSTTRLIRPFRIFYSIRDTKVIEKKVSYLKINKYNYFWNLLSNKLFKITKITIPQYQLIFLDRLYNFVWRPLKTLILFFKNKKSLFSIKINNFLNSNWQFQYVWYYYTIYYSNYLPLHLIKRTKKKNFKFLTSSKNIINYYIIKNEYNPLFKTFQSRTFPSIIAYYEYPKYIKYWLTDLSNFEIIKYKLGVSSFPDWNILRGFTKRKKNYKIIKQFGPFFYNKTYGSHLYFKYLNYLKYYYFDPFTWFNFSFFSIGFFFFYMYNFMLESSLNLNLLLNLNHYLIFKNTSYSYYLILLLFNFFLFYIYCFWFTVFYQFYLTKNFDKTKNIFFNIFFFFKNSYYFINSLTYNINYFHKNNLTYLPYNITFKIDKLNYNMKYNLSFETIDFLRYSNFYYNYFNLNKSISNEILSNFMDLIYPWFLNSVGSTKFGFVYLKENFTLFDDDDLVWLSLFSDLNQPYKKNIIKFKIFYQDIDYFFGEDTWFRIFNEQKFTFSFDQLDYEERVRWDNFRYLRWKDNQNYLNNVQNLKKLYSKELFKSSIIYPLDKGYYRTLNERIVDLFYENSADYGILKFNEINLWLNIFSYFFISTKNNFFKFLIFKFELFLKPFGLIDYSIFKPIWSIYYRYHLKYLLSEYLNKNLTINFWDKDIATIGDNDYLGNRTIESNFHTNLNDDYEIDPNEFVDDDLLDNLIEDIDQFNGQVGPEFYKYKNFYYDVPNAIKKMPPYFLKHLYNKFLNKNQSFYSNAQEKRIEDSFFERYTEYYLYNCIKPLPNWYYKILFLPDIFAENAADSTDKHLQWNYPYLLTFGQTNYYQFGIAYENLFFKQVGFNNWIPYLYFFFYPPFVILPAIVDLLIKKNFLYYIISGLILKIFNSIFNFYIKKSTIYYVCFNLFQFILFLINKYIINLIIDGVWIYFLLNNSNINKNLFNFNFFYDLVNFKKINFFLQNKYNLKKRFFNNNNNNNLNLFYNQFKSYYYYIINLNKFIKIKYFFYNYIYFYYLKYLNFKYTNILSYFLINLFLIIFLISLIFYLNIINFSIISILIFNYGLNLYTYLFLPIFICLMFLFYNKIFKFSKDLLDSDFETIDDLFFLTAIFIPFMFFFDFVLLKMFLFDGKRARDYFANLYGRPKKYPLHRRQGQPKSKKLKTTNQYFLKKNTYFYISRWHTLMNKKNDLFLINPLWFFDGGHDQTFGPRNEIQHEKNFKAAIKRKSYKLP